MATIISTASRTWRGQSRPGRAIDPPRSRCQASINSPAATNRLPAKNSGGTASTPTLMAIQVVPQIRHMAANMRRLPFMVLGPF